MLSERFGPDFTRSVLWLMLHDEAFSLGTIRWLEPASFKPPQSWIFQEFVSSITQGRPPDVLILKEKAKDLPVEEVGITLSELTAVATSSVSDCDGMKDLVKDYAKRSKFAKAFHTSREMYLQGQAEQAYSYMTDQMEEIRGVSFEKIERAWLAEDFDERQRRRELRTLVEDGIPTGLAPYDNLTGGIKAGQVFSVMAYSKGGKTQWLRHCGGIAARMRKRVLHIQLEGSLDETVDAYDAWFSNEVVTNIRSGIFDPTKLATVKAAYSQLKQMLVVRCLNEWDITVLDIEAEIRDLASSQGFRPDLIILDYLDLLRARNKRLTNETEIQTQTSKDTKKLALRVNCGIHTAMQVSRPKDGWENKPHIIRGSKIADAYAKIRPLDLSGSWNRTDVESNAGLGRMFIEHFRHNQAARMFPCRTDFGCSKFFYDPMVKIDPLTKAAILGDGVMNIDPKALPKVQQDAWWHD